LRLRVRGAGGAGILDCQRRRNRGCSNGGLKRLDEALEAGTAV
jgi:hypothetical protein